ncbi:hypothetical protein [Sphingobacterium multivorum]|uniref:hypothetical protein n=1 Tax=Sphingobacterium multivorum TaxID=28454 RepID=UPI0028A62112|nr:hypothetical protein [Sphingobacterium multivorum]
MTKNNNIVADVQGAEVTTNEQKEWKSVDIMIPTHLLNKLQELYINDSIPLAKIIFTVHWINKGKYNPLNKSYYPYQEVSNRYVNWLGLNAKQAKNFLKNLEDYGIIKIVGKGVKDKNYTLYSMVNPFDYKGGKATEINTDWEFLRYFTEDFAFIKKYCETRGVVKIPSRTKKQQTKLPVESVDISTGEITNVTEELNNIKMTLKEVLDNYYELSNKISALEAENAELKKELNKKADIVTSLKSEIQQYTLSRIEEPKVFENPDEINTDIIYDSKENTPFFNNDDDIDFVEDLIKKVQDLITPDEFIDFAQPFELNNTGIVELPKVESNINTSREIKVSRIVRRHFKKTVEVKLITNFIINNEHKGIIYEDLLSTGVGMSGATAQRLLDDIRSIYNK